MTFPSTRSEILPKTPVNRCLPHTLCRDLDLLLTGRRYPPGVSNLTRNRRDFELFMRRALADLVPKSLRLICRQLLNLKESSAISESFGDGGAGEL